MTGSSLVKAFFRGSKVIRPRSSYHLSGVLSACFLLVLIIAGCGSTETAELSDLEIKLTKEAAPIAVEATRGVIEATPADESPQQPIEGEQVITDDDPSPSAALQEAGATATARALELEATSIAAVQANETSKSATVAALAPIHEELALLGVNPNEGVIGFVHPPISLEVTDFESYDYANRNIFTIAGDFVLAADITWESAYAESGCGYVVRSDGDEEAPSQYIIGLTRGADGHLLFAEQIAGSVDLQSITDIYANGIDPLFEWQSGTTNRIVIVGRDQEFTVFSNGTRIGSVTGTAGLEEGFVAFIAINRSGGIKCDYNNAWLWKIN